MPQALTQKAKIWAKAHSECDSLPAAKAGDT